jgi:hypothetical protein
MRQEPARRLMVTNQTLGMALKGDSRPFVGVPLVHLERLFMPDIVEKLLDWSDTQTLSLPSKLTHM